MEPFWMRKKKEGVKMACLGSQQPYPVPKHNQIFSYTSPSTLSKVLFLPIIKQVWSSLVSQSSAVTLWTLCLTTLATSSAQERKQVWNSEAKENSPRKSRSPPQPPSYPCRPSLQSRTLWTQSSMPCSCRPSWLWSWSQSSSPWTCPWQPP